MFLKIIIYCALIGVLTVSGSEKPRAKTKLGIVEGQWQTSFEGRIYASFEGVPYAKPPIGDLRFEESQPIEPWKGIWNASKEYMCTQAAYFDPSLILGDEDCLYVNVYVPKINTVQKLDVVVHIHGGSFMWGHGQQFLGAKYMMDRDLILVSMNYRLNALGFLSTEDDVVPGNNGLKDQVLALKWIQDHIESFGGNPKSVTITGFSAGGASVEFHYLSPLSKGLFTRGMSVSGTALGPWAIRENPLKMTKKLAQAVGCDSDSTRDIVACLKNRPANLLVDSIRSNLYLMYRYPLCPLGPVVEKWGNNPFITEDPYVMLKKGRVLDAPWINSHTTHEGYFSSLEFLDNFEEILANWTRVFKYITESDETIPEKTNDKIANKVKDYYLSDVKDSKDAFTKVTQMITDRLLKSPTETAADLHSKVTKSPVYFYVFDFYGKNSMRYLLHKNPPPGVYHGDDMVYFFGGQINEPLTETELKMKTICMDFLESYAKTGVPTLKGIPLEPIKEQFVYYKISDPDRIHKEIKTDYSTNNLWFDSGMLEGENLLRTKEEL